MSSYFAAGAAMYVFVLLKSLQQLHVVHAQVKWVMPTSLAMACAEVFVLLTVVDKGFGWVVLFVGVGGGLGALTGIHLHKRLNHE